MPNRKQLVVFYFLSLTWGILLTLVGLFSFLFIYLFMRKQVEIRVIAGRISVKFKYIYFGGLSLGLVYFVDKSDNLNTHKHELGHTIQNTWFGPLFPFLIGIPSVIRFQLWDFLSKRYRKKYNKSLSYDSIWFEGQATKLGYKYFDKYINEKIGGN